MKGESLSLFVDRTLAPQDSGDYNISQKFFGQLMADSKLNRQGIISEETVELKKFKNLSADLPNVGKLAFIFLHLIWKIIEQVLTLKKMRMISCNELVLVL